MPKPMPDQMPLYKKGREHLVAKEIYEKVFGNDNLVAGSNRFFLAVGGYGFKVEVKEVGKRREDNSDSGEG